MSSYVDNKGYPVIYGYGYVDRKFGFHDCTLSTQQPCEFCFECNHDLAYEDYKINEVQELCTACKSVRWYIIVPHNTSHTTDEITLISGPFPQNGNLTRGFHLACKFLDKNLLPLYGNAPDIDGYVIEPEDPETSAGQVMAHARYPNDFTNLPAASGPLHQGRATKPRIVPWPTELVLPGAYENLSPIATKSLNSKTYVKHHRNDSGIALASDEKEEFEDLPLIDTKSSKDSMKHRRSDSGIGLASDEEGSLE